MTLSGVTSTGTTYTLTDDDPAYFFGFMSYNDITTGGAGYIRYEFSADGGSTYAILYDSIPPASINRLASTRSFVTAGTTPGHDYKVRITLKNNASGYGPKVYRFLVATDPSPWRW